MAKKLLKKTNKKNAAYRREELFQLIVVGYNSPRQGNQRQRLYAGRHNYRQEQRMNANTPVLNSHSPLNNLDPNPGNWATGCGLELPTSVNGIMTIPPRHARRLT